MAKVNDCYLCGKSILMLQVSVLRNDTAEVKRRLAVKHFKQPELVDTIIQLDDERKRLQAEFDNTQSKVNTASKEIGKLMAQGQKEAAETLKTDVAGWKAALEPLKEQMARVEKELNGTYATRPPSARAMPSSAAIW